LSDWGHIDRGEIKLTENLIKISQNLLNS